jgi:hypothetical protein
MSQSDDGDQLYSHTTVSCSYVRLRGSQRSEEFISMQSDLYRNTRFDNQGDNLQRLRGSQRSEESNLMQSDLYQNTRFDNQGDNLQRLRGSTMMQSYGQR